MMRPTALLLLATLATLAGRAASGEELLYERYFAVGDGAAPCYAATFDEAALAARPGQQFSRFGVRASRAEDQGPPFTFELAFVWTMTGATGWKATEASCSMSGEGADCLIDSDGAAYAVAPDGDGIRLTAGPLTVDGAFGLTEFFGDGEGKTIRLAPASAALCETD